MAYNFPGAPTLGQISNGYVWDGEKWLSGFGGGLTVTDADLRYVNVNGDVMTGDLQTTNLGVKPASGTGSIQVQDNPATSTSYMQTSTTGLKLSNNAGAVKLEANTNAGTNTGQFDLYTNGDVGMANTFYVKGSVIAGSGGAGGTYYFGNTNTKYLSYTGTYYQLTGGQLIVGGPGSANHGVVAYGTINCSRTTAGSWPAEVTGVDRGTLYLATGTASIACYFCQGNTGNMVGQITNSTTSTAYQTSSDGRKKPVREPFSGLDIIHHLNPVYHNWVNEPDQWDYGLIAQEAYEVLPQMIFKGDDDAAKKSGDEGFVSWSADYSKAVPVLIRAVQELSAVNADLLSRLEALEAKNGV